MQDVGRINQRFLNVFNKIKSRTGSENYPAAVEMALYMLRVGNAPLFIEATAE